MSARLLNLLDRLPSSAQRWLMILVPLALLGVLVTGFVLAPQGTGRHPEQASVTGRLLPPTPTAATPAPAQPTRTGEVERHECGRVRRINPRSVGRSASSLLRRHSTVPRG